MTSSRKNKGFTLNDVLKMQQEEEKRKIERIISVLRNHEISTPADIHKDIKGFVGWRNELMRHHVFGRNIGCGWVCNPSFELLTKLMLTFVVMMPLLALWRGWMNLWTIRSDTLLRSKRSI